MRHLYPLVRPALKGIRSGSAPDGGDELINVFVACPRVQEHGLFAGKRAVTAFGVVPGMGDEFDPVSVEPGLTALEEALAMITGVPVHPLTILRGILEVVFEIELGFDIADPFCPREVAHFVPPAPVCMVDPRPNRPQIIQSNDVYVAPDGLMYLTDVNDGLTILQYRG